MAIRLLVFGASLLYPLELLPDSEFLDTALFQLIQSSAVPFPVIAQTNYKIDEVSDELLRNVLQRAAILGKRAWAQAC
jgi:hypothetical protein